MNTLKIKTYSKTLKLIDHCFFILSKGNNAGKPLILPCPNCFVLFADNPTEKDFYFWLLYGLWQGKFFFPYLCGSVIPFIRLNDLKLVIADANTNVIKKQSEYLKTITILQNLEQQQTIIQKQMNLIKMAKVTLMHQVLKP